MAKKKFDFNSEETARSAEAYFKCADFKTTLKNKTLMVEGEDEKLIEGLFARFADKYFIML